MSRMMTVLTLFVILVGGQPSRAGEGSPSQESPQVEGDVGTRNVPIPAKGLPGISGSARPGGGMREPGPSSFPVSEETPKSTADNPASELSQELGIEGQIGGSEVGSRAVTKPLNPAVMRQNSRATMAPQTWDALWAVSWKRANTYYRIQAAPTTLHDPMCANPLMLDVFVRDTIQAIAIRKYGDAARFMSQFQDRSLCLTREGIRGVEFALSFYLHHALISLPPPQARIAVQGVVNLGMLTFDQLQYTRRSWWLLTIMSHARMMGPHMVDYPRADLGAWFYDPRLGLMLKSRFPDALDRFIGAMRRVENFGRGTCAIIDMSEEGFVCQDDYSGLNLTTGKTGSGSKLDKLPRMPDTIPPNAASCVLQSVQAVGARGTMACMSKAMAGFTYNPRAGLQDKTIPDTSQAGIRDKMCALSDEAGGETSDGANANEKAGEAKEPSTWDKFKESVSNAGKAVKEAAEQAWEFVKNVFDLTPPVISEVGQGASTEGADAERGAKQMIDEIKARDSLLKDDGADQYYQDRDKRISTDPQWDKGRMAGDGGPDGGKCSVRSNAAARAKSLYRCIDKPAAPGRYANSAPEAVPPSGQQQPPSSRAKRYTIVDGRLVEAHSSTTAGGATEGGAASVSKGGGSPTLDPNLIYVDPTLEQMAAQSPGSGSSQPTGFMACMMQAGDLVRASLNDPRCNSLQRCVGNQPCPCDRQSPPTGTQPGTFRDPSRPNCANGQCDSPDPMGTPNPRPKPTFNPGRPSGPPPGPTPR